MLGAIIGDVVGSVYEFHNHRSKDFELVTDKNFYTDDTVLTVALMDWAVHAEIRDSYSVVEYLQKWGRKYPDCGFGTRFKREWLWSDNPKPYNSKGNGSGMRVSPVAYLANNLQELELLSDLVTSVTHNHYEGILGARVVSRAIWMALHNYSKEEIREMAEYFYPVIVELDYEDLKKNYRFNELSETTCPQAIFCFLISNDFEDCLRTSVSIGGDTDTLCAMSCAIAEAYYKNVSTELHDSVLDKLPEEMKNVIYAFDQNYDNQELQTDATVGHCAVQRLALRSLRERIVTFKKNITDDEYWMTINGLAINSLASGQALKELREYFETKDERALGSEARNLILHWFGLYRIR